MSFGAAVAPLVLEGDYSTYTQKSYSPISDVNISNRFFAYFDDDEEIVYIADCYGNSLKSLNLSTGALTTLLSLARLSDAHADLDPSNKYVSVLHKYLVVFDMDTSPVTLKVYKNGSLVFSFQLPTSSSGYTVSISPSGRWIIIIDDTNSIYYVLEGS